MYEFALFLEPTDFWLWVAKAMAVILASYFAVWLLALVLWRWKILGRDDPVLRVELSWLISLCVQTIALTTMVLYLARYFKEFGVSSWYLAGFLASILFSVIQGHERHTNVARRLMRQRPSSKEGG